MQKPSVDPAFTFAVALLVSLVLWYPTMRETLGGSIDITDSGIRYFLALAIAWAGAYGISSLVAMYASQPRKPSPPPGAAAHPARRRDDETPEPAPAPTDEQDANAA